MVCALGDPLLRGDTFRVKLMGGEHLIYCPMFLRCTFHDIEREILRHILRCLGLPVVYHGCPVKGSERWVVGAVPLSSAGFRGA